MLPKKNPPYDLEPKRPFHFALSLVMVMFLVVTAFEWRSEQSVLVTPQDMMYDPFEDEVIMRTTQPPPEPPRPVIKNPVIEEVSNDKVVEDIAVEITTETDDFRIEDLPVDIPDEPPVTIFEGIVEQMPEPVGGYPAFYQFLSKQLRYPPLAKRLHVQGRVFVQFVVDSEGELSNIQVIKGIGSGCDEEALRVMKKAPRWNPGKQRGRAVNVRMVIPIVFRLQ